MIGGLRLVLSLFVLILFINVVSAAFSNNDLVGNLRVTTINNFTINGTSAVHNDLTGLQGGDVGEYYHLKQLAYNSVTANYASWLNWSNALNGTLLTYADALNVSITGASDSFRGNYSNFTNIYKYAINNSLWTTNWSNFTTMYGYILNASAGGISWATATNGTLATWGQVMNGTVGGTETQWNANYSTFLNKMPYSAWNATNTSYYLQTNPFSFYNSTTLPATTETLWNANYSTFLTHLTNATSSFTANYSTFLTHMPYSAWNSTNTSYYLQTNPFSFYNVTTAPTYTNNTFTANYSNFTTIYGNQLGNSSWNANYSTFLTHITWANAVNGTLLTYAQGLNNSFFHPSDWNATNTSYMTYANWNATNTSYIVNTNSTYGYSLNNTLIQNASLSNYCLTNGTGGASICHNGTGWVIKG
jgi:hypothetical protein